MTFEYELHEREEKVKLEMVDAMFANSKLTDEDIASISGFSREEIQKRRAQRWCKIDHHFGENWYKIE